jgi:hypothetical protein
MISSLRKTLLVAEMVTRDLLRRRAVLALLAMVPLAFYLARHDEYWQAVRFVSLGLGWAVSTLALFSGTAGKESEPRLRQAGYTATQLYVGRLAGLMGIGFLLAAAYSVIILVDLDLARPTALVLQLVVTVVVAAPLGLLVGALVPRDLEGMLVLITMLSLQFLMDPAKSSARVLPLWSTRELGTYTIEAVDAAYLERGLTHALAYTSVLVLVTATLSSVRLRRRRHLRFSV